MTSASATAPSLLRRLGRFAYRRHRRVLLAWVAGIVLLAVASSAIGNGYSQSFGDFESEATRGFDLVERGFGISSGENTGSIVFVAEAGIADPTAHAAIEALLTEVARHGGPVRRRPHRAP